MADLELLILNGVKKMRDFKKEDSYVSVVKYQPNDDPEKIDLFQTDVDCQAIFDLARTKKEGDLLSYDEAAKVVVRCKDIEVIKKKTQYVARKMLREGYVFDPIENYGYKRLTPPEIIDVAPRKHRYARNKFRRNRKALLSANDKKLNNSQKVRKNTMLAICGMILHLANPNEIKKTESKSNNHKLSFDPKANLKYLFGS